ncbi:GFA family protein [Vitreimonas sp.]|uniref:GFA family protein n=1 Tax=Vitreimonas sp. TaxID=3069702 RepID=UPI002ED82F2C
MSETFEGGCSCGAVRYRLTSRPMFTNCCHCLDCQKQTGGAFAINAMIETSRIEMLSGEPVVIEMPSPSGRGHEVHRCPKCEVALWSNYGRRTWMRFVRVATLDAPHAIKPDAHIFTRSRVPWVKLPEDTPAFEIYYDTAKQWSPESLARLAAASGKA